MKRKIYVFIIGIISLITIATAFIPIQSHDNETLFNNKETKTLIHDGPESGYIEAIGD